MIIRDDMVDTAGTIVLAADALIQKGAREVYACATHPVLSGPALERIGQSLIKKFVVADTIDLSQKRLPRNFEALSAAPLFGETILRISEGESVSSLFD